MKKRILPVLLMFITGLVMAQAPVITSFYPASGPPGTLVTITGTNLKNVTVFKIGDTTAIVVSDTSVIASNSGDTLLGLVMPAAVTAVISVTTASGTATSSKNFTVLGTLYPGFQQGNKLTGTGNTGSAQQGRAVSISTDGNTAIVGGPDDNSHAGAAWVYTRSSGAWTQQGSKLVGAGAVNASNGAQQGWSVSISADGNTAVIGGWNDNNNTGAAWIFTRFAGIWSQQGSKLVGLGAAGEAEQGCSVSVSADGNTVIVGGLADNSNAGAAWIFTRSAGVWSQQGSKLVGSGAVNATNGAQQGNSVSLSADGNTAIVGGYTDDSNIGAAWVYIRSAGTWAQQGSKLVGTNAAGEAEQGCSVSVSADGNTAIVGGFADNSDVGAAWVYTRSGGVWTQQGTKLVATGSTGLAWEGYSVSISSDGNTAIVGGYFDNYDVGAAWVYARSAGTWTQQGNKLVGAGSAGNAEQGWSVSVSANGNTAVVGGFNDDSSTGAAWIFVNDTCTVTANTNSTPSCGGNNGSVSATASGGRPSYTYAWSTGASAQTVNGLSANSYTVTVTDAKGCSLTAVQTVNNSSPGSLIFNPVLNISCFGDNNGSVTAILSSGTPPYTYNWSNSVAGPTDSGLSPGTYTVTATDSTGCLSSASVALTQPAPLTVTTSTTAAYSWLSNGTASTDATGGTGAYSYSWIPGGATGQTLTGLSCSGEYTVTVTDAMGCNATATAAVSCVLGIKDLSTDIDLKIFPNPNSGTFTIQSFSEGLYSIVNSIGQTVQFFRLTAGNSYLVNIENLSSGIYFIVGHNGNQTAGQKVVVSN